MSDFERGQIVNARSAGASVTQTARLLAVPRVTVPKVMSAYTNNENIISAKRKSGQKSTITEGDNDKLRRIVSQNHRTTAAQLTGEQN
jgi:hypothetical protein